MLKWHKDTPHQKPSCAGAKYYSFLDSVFDKQFIKYDNGVEGIRIEGEFRVRGGIERLPPPVPDLSTKKADGTWHYTTMRGLSPSHAQGCQ